MIACGGPGPDVPASPREGLREGRPPPGSKHSSLWSWLFGTLLSRGESLRGKRALVSGSGGGLGRELSVLLVQQGCKVICVDQDAVQVQETLGLTRLDDRPAARGYACDWRNPGEALGLSRAVATTEGGVDIIFVVPESNNNNESAVDSTGKIIGNEFWPLLGFLPGMLARARGHVVHVLDEHNAHKTGMVADAWIESLQEVGADVRYTKVYLHADQARHRPCRAEDAARSIVAAVRQGSSEVRIAYPIC